MPLPFPSNLFYCSTLSPLICWVEDVFHVEDDYLINYIIFLSKNIHKFVTCNCFLLIQVHSQFVQFFPVFGRIFLAFSCSAFTSCTTFSINFLLGICGTGKRRIAAKILVGHGFHCHHVEFICHAVAGDHRSCNFCCLFDIIGGSCRDLTKYDLLCRTSACKCNNLILKFFFSSSDIYHPAQPA